MCLAISIMRSMNIRHHMVSVVEWCSL